MKSNVQVTGVLATLMLFFVTTYAQEDNPLDDETLRGLVISVEPILSMQPGTTKSFGVVYRGSFDFKPVKARIVWSVEPNVGARINPQTGEFKIEGNTPHGTTFEVRADVEDGRRVLTQKVYVYTSKANPLVGVWEETSQLSCKGKRVLKVDAPVRELQFHADGRFAVTFFPLETRKDYWGKYNFDLESGSLKLEVDGGNDVPSTMDGEGTFFKEKNGELTLEGIWLGSPGQYEKRVEKPNVCRMIFTRSW